MHSERLVGVYFRRCWIRGEQMVINTIFFIVGAWAVRSHPDYSRGQRGDCTHRYHKELCVAGQFGWRIYSYYTGKRLLPVHLRCGASINKVHFSLQHKCFRFGMMQDQIKLLYLSRATQMSCGVWRSIPGSLTSWPVAMTGRCACGNPVPISSFGPRAWR